MHGYLTKLTNVKKINTKNLKISRLSCRYEKSMHNWLFFSAPALHRVGAVKWTTTALVFSRSLAGCFLFPCRAIKGAETEEAKKGRSAAKIYEHQILMRLTCLQSYFSAPDDHGPGPRYSPVWPLARPINLSHWGGYARWEYCGAGAATRRRRRTLDWFGANQVDRLTPGWLNSSWRWPPVSRVCVWDAGFNSVCVLALLSKLYTQRTQMRLGASLSKIKQDIPKKNTGLSAFLWILVLLPYNLSSTAINGPWLLMKIWDLNIYLRDL